MGQEANMSTISLQPLEQSALLCKRFATLVSSFFDAPEQASAPAARVPLENLFRILQMFRYDAFSDERRSGVLAIGTAPEHPALQLDDENWHTRIETALGNALSNTFAGIPKEDAIQQIQTSLRWLATNRDAPPVDTRSRSKSFLDHLTADLG
jgi:hypothetical protein